MELRHLRYFVAVAEEQHLGRAARRLHVSPPPLSKQVQQLEEELGVALFARVGRGLQLTEGGRLFLEKAHAILADVAKSVTAVQAAARGEAGHVTLGFTETSTHATMIPEITAELRRRHPHVGIELLTMNPADQIAALAAGRIDASFGNDEPTDPAIRFDVLLRERVLVALPRDHRLAARKAVRVDDLRGESFVWMPRSSLPEVFQRAAATLAARGFAMDVAVEARSSAMRIAMVAAGMAITIVLESTAPAIPKTLVLRPIVDFDLTFDSVLAWRAADADSVLVRSLRGIAASVVRAHTPKEPHSSARIG
jgi:DNA-binding transcriptional LysR family regulator